MLGDIDFVLGAVGHLYTTEGPFEKYAKLGQNSKWTLS